MITASEFMSRATRSDADWIGEWPLMVNLNAFRKGIEMSPLPQHVQDMIIRHTNTGAPMDDLVFRTPAKPMNQPDYTAATADVLTAATLAKPEAKKAAVEAVLRSYFPVTGPGPSMTHAGETGTTLYIRPDGRVEHWEGNTYRLTYSNLLDAYTAISRRQQS